MAYETEGLLTGEYTTDQVPLAIDVYYRGMPLEYDTVNHRYQYLATGTLAAFYIGADARNVTVAGEIGPVCNGGEIIESGIVDNAGAAYTITEDLRATWSAAQFKLKR